MYVSNEVRRREVPENAPDPSLYASTASGASFMAILSEVGGAPEKPTGESDATSEVSDATKLPEQATHESEQGGGVDTDTEGTETAEATSGTPAEPATEASPQSEAVPGTPAMALPTVAQSSDAGESTELTSVAMPTLPVSNELSTSAETVPESELTTDAPALSESVEVSLPLEAREHSDGADVADASALLAAGEADATLESPSAPALFPKTLNAIIAEGALRQSSDSVPLEKRSPADGVEALEVAIDHNAAQATDLQDSAPLPQAAALESGGVRPQASSLPRLPMANLPGELAQQMHLMQQEGTRSMRFRLVPENLGELRIEVHGTGDSLRVRMVSANPAVRDALESQMGDLKDALQKQGLALDNATVGSESARREAAREPERRPAPTPYRALETPIETPASTTRTSAPLALGSSALNILA